MQLAKCDECKKVFNINVKKRREDTGNYQIYFQCPHCKNLYHCYYENDTSLALQDEINALKNQLMNSRVMGKNIDFKNEFNKREKTKNRITNLIKKKKDILNRLNRRLKK